MFVIICFFFIQRFYIWYGKEINICLDCKSQCTGSVHLARKGGIVFYQPGHDLCKQKHSTIILVEAEIYLDVLLELRKRAVWPKKQVISPKVCLKIDRDVHE